MSSDQPPNDDSDRPPGQLRAFVQSLEPGDEVLINRRDNRLVVTDFSPQIGDDSVTRITLTGNGTTYTMTLCEDVAVPVLTWPSAAHSHPVQEIRPANTTILSTDTVSEFFPSIPMSSEKVEATQEEQSWEGDIDLSRILGSCPNCDSIVVEDQWRAFCRTCGSWCWREQWDAYVNSEETGTK
jgi:hypothetical protein